MKQQIMAAVAVAALGVGGSLVAGAADLRAAADGQGRNAATMRLADGRAVGTVRFLPDRDGTRVTVTLRMPADLAGTGSTFHGFHVHANSDPANGTGCVADPAAAPSTWFVSADGHLSEPGATHGEHTGDLPVVYVEEGGESRATFVTDRFEPADVVGRAVIVHARPDNYGNVPPAGYTPTGPAAVDLTARTGNAGDRVACGVVGR